MVEKLANFMSKNKTKGILAILKMDFIKEKEG
jgi:hypothetical protein